MDPMHVVVCIVGFRNSLDIIRCLEALERSEHTGFEVVICENGGEEAFLDLRAALPEVLNGGQAVTLMLADRNLGYAGGVNACIRMKTLTPADAWWVLNPDTVVDPGALGALLRRLSAGDCDVVGGTIISTGGRVESRGGRWRAWLARSEVIGAGEPGECGVDVAAIEQAASFISGACMLVSRRLVEDVGLMREDYFLYCEEVEWCLRGLARGYRLGYAPEARVVHLGGTTTGAVSDIRQRSRTSVYLDERNKILLTRDLFPARAPVAVLAALALLLLRFGKRGAWRQLGYALDGWCAGLQNRRGPPNGFGA